MLRKPGRLSPTGSCVNLVSSRRAVGRSRSRHCGEIEKEPMESPPQERRRRSTAELEAELRLARAVAAGEVRTFIVTEAEAIPGVRSAALLPRGPVEASELNAV